jgi:hypothetical protein
LHLASGGAGIPKISARVSVLRFFFKVTLDCSGLSRHAIIHEPRKPGVLSPDRMACFLEAASKYKAGV